VPHESPLAASAFPISARLSRSTNPERYPATRSFSILSVVFSLRVMRIPAAPSTKPTWPTSAAIWRLTDRTFAFRERWATIARMLPPPGSTKAAATRENALVGRAGTRFRIAMPAVPIYGEGRSRMLL
jgi:hypothetical protein